MKHETKGGAARDIAKLTPEQAKKVMTFGVAMAVIGIGLAGAAYAADKQRFAFSYLAGFMFVTTIALGALIFVLIQHVTRAGWSVGPRRQMEWFAGVLPWCAALFLPIAATAHTLYDEWMGPHGHEDKAIAKKLAYLNSNFFYGRAAFYFAAWAILAIWFGKLSADQDAAKKPSLTTKMQAASAPSIFVAGLTLTFAAFDWLMSLDPKWYSTIFGVYIFAGGFWAALALLALVTLFLQGKGFLQKVSTVEHRHDIGKLLFGFTVFWAYIAFSQFFLIWYANIPEETIFFKHRWIGSWQDVSMLLLFGHFVIPFLWLLPRTVKRHKLGLGLMAAWCLVMHYVDMYWLVMPNLDHHGAHFTWIDLGGLLGPVGVGALAVSLRVAKGNLFPVGDPRLPEAVRLQNL
jgi:hypothetical protein